MLYNLTNSIIYYNNNSNVTILEITNNFFLLRYLYSYMYILCMYIFLILVDTATTEVISLLLLGRVHLVWTRVFEASICHYTTGLCVHSEHVLWLNAIKHHATYILLYDNITGHRCLSLWKESLFLHTESK